MDYSFQKWVHKEDYHLTLAFLGPSSQEKYQSMMNDLRISLQNQSGFMLGINQIGIFGLAEKPRILWCAPYEWENLITLQQVVSHCCQVNGYQLDKKKFNPHITLARKYEGNALFTKKDLDKCGNLFKEDIIFKAEKITLYETHIDQTPKYQIIDSIELT